MSDHTMSVEEFNRHVADALTKPCPFCGDPRRPDVEERELKFERSSIFTAVCQCCGAEGPCADNRGSALILWDERRAPEAQAGFLALAERLSAATPRPLNGGAS